MSNLRCTLLILCIFYSRENTNTHLLKTYTTSNYVCILLAYSILWHIVRTKNLKIFSFCCCCFLTHNSQSYADCNHVCATVCSTRQKGAELPRRAVINCPYKSLHLYQINNTIHGRTIRIHKNKGKYLRHLVIPQWRCKIDHVDARGCCYIRLWRTIFWCTTNTEAWLSIQF